jgi:hypothetical protein
VELGTFEGMALGSSLCTSTELGLLDMVGLSDSWALEFALGFALGRYV